jgi:hypothetical protein
LYGKRDPSPLGTGAERGVSVGVVLGACVALGRSPGNTTCAGAEGDIGGEGSAERIGTGTETAAIVSGFDARLLAEPPK